MILKKSPGNHKLLILFLAIVAAHALTFYANFFENKNTAFYPHFFYIPIILASLWYQKKAVYVALFFGLVYIVAIHLSPSPFSLYVLATVGIFIGVAYIIGFISQKSIEEEGLKAEQVIRHQAALLELTKINYLDSDSALKKITEIASRTLSIERVSIWLFSEDYSAIICEDLYKLSENLHEKGLRFEAYGSPHYFQALKDSRVLVVNDACTDPRTRELAAEYLKPFGITSMVDVPIRLCGKFVGIVCHEHVGPKREWTPEEKDFAASIVDIVSLALETLQCKRVETALKSSFVQLAETISRAIEDRDPYTAGHQRRVADMSRRVGEKMGLDEEQLQGLYVAGLLHDVGKISIPAVILSYPGKLSEAEWALIRSHTRHGYEILKEVKFLWPVAEMALRHHERLNGSGYPDKLKGHELSLEVRILAACDVAEAMSSWRPYRPARSQKEVQKELFQGRGIKYDPEVVDILLGFLNGS